jgi:hypothetical protein
MGKQRPRPIAPAGPYWKSGATVDEDLRMRSLARPLVLAAALAVVGCGGSGHSSGVSNGTAHSATASSVEAQLSQRGITLNGGMHCNGPAPGVIDCTGKTSDGKAVSATLTAKTSGTTCTGPLVISVGSTQVASVANAKCS